MSPAKILSEQDLFRTRVICIALAIAFVFSFLGGRLWYLQVIEHTKNIRVTQKVTESGSA